MANGYQPVDADVIIVGAGIAGMTAALTLYEKVQSMHVLVLEAEDRLGGRAISFPLRGRDDKFYKFDLAGHYISSRQEPLMDLVTKLKLPLISQSRFDGKILLEYGPRILQRDRSKGLLFGNVYHKYHMIAFTLEMDKLSKMDRLEPEVATKNLAQYINETVGSPIATALINFIIFSYCGVPPEDLTLGFYVMYCASIQGIFYSLITTDKGVREACITTGIQEICNKIMEKVHNSHILKAHRVIEIRKSKDTVAVKTHQKTFFCHNVIMAVPPPSVLDINFIPSLSPEKTAALSSYVTGKLIKFVVMYETPFWRDMGLSGDVFVLNDPTTERPLVCCFDVTRLDDTPALSGLIIQVQGNHRPLVLSQLKDYFGNNAMGALNYVEKSWETGSPMNCCRTVEDMDLARASWERIYWCGSETTVEWYGTIAGAVASGRRAAVEVLYDMRPAVLTVQDMSLIMPRKKPRRGTYNPGVPYFMLINRWYISVPVGLGVAYLLFKTWQYARQ